MATVKPIEQDPSLMLDERFAVTDILAAGGVTRELITTPEAVVMQAAANLLTEKEYVDTGKVAALIGIYPGSAAGWIRRINAKYNIFEQFTLPGKKGLKLYRPTELGEAVLAVFKTEED